VAVLDEDVPASVVYVPMMRFAQQHTVPSALLLLAIGLGACGSSMTQQAPGAPPPAASASQSQPAASATRGSQPATSATMPNLVGWQLQSAQDRIQSLTNFGIAVTTSHDATGAGRHQVWDRNWKVCSQNIPPGTAIDSGTRIDFGAVKIEESCP
jgi:hypothetical protein